MPYVDKVTGAIRDRVSEVLNAPDCETTAYLLKKGDPKRPREANAVTIPGSTLHYRIAAYISRTKGFPPPPVFRPNPGEKAIIDNWRELGILESELTVPVNEAFQNFLKFWSDHEIDPIAVEQYLEHDFEYKGKKRKLSGTVDLVARVKLFGIVDENNMFRQCIHVSPDPRCQCSQHLVVTILDWKNSKTKQKNNQMQLTVYGWMGTENGKMKIWTENGKYPINAVHWSLLLKTRLGIRDYNLIRYERDFKDFFRGYNILDDPRPVPRNHRTGNVGISMRCSFCSDRPSCPTIGRYVPKSDSEIAGLVVIGEE